MQTNMASIPASYHAWLPNKEIICQERLKEYREWCTVITYTTDSLLVQTAAKELKRGLAVLLRDEITVQSLSTHPSGIVLSTYQEAQETVGKEISQELEELNDESYVIRLHNHTIWIIGKTGRGTLYGAFHFLRYIQDEQPIKTLSIVDYPRNQIRMMNQWDNMDGSIERGYAGQSIFFANNDFIENKTRVRDYARLLASVGINAISINNVNVWEVETELITEKFLPKVADVAAIFRSYGITVYLSINFASPIALGHLETADPLVPEVQEWWNKKVEEIYRTIPDFGGFVVKADSEHRPGPFSYGRNHADGANVLAKALQPFNGVVIWRCFVYNCLQDWRDRSTDRARAAYDHFKPLDGAFLDNVILQIKNGPMDFQVREPVSPLFGALESTNQVLELQVTQEYTGQQKDVCYLVPLWKEVLDFDTFAKGEGTTVKRIVSGNVYNNRFSGIAAVSNIGDDLNWTGHTLAQANLFGYGRLIWNPDLSTEEITKEWVHLTFGHDPITMDRLEFILTRSWQTYENYTAPLGVGWMVNINHHYGPNIDGYEYSVWGTYHFADRDGIGVDRTVETGTGYTEQYHSPNFKTFNSLEECPDDFLLFFHHVPYTHTLKSGKTVIQHIYDTHFKGYEDVELFIKLWDELEGKVDQWTFEQVRDRFQMQVKNAREWRDIVNTYFYRKSGIEDKAGRTIY